MVKHNIFMLKGKDVFHAEILKRGSYISQLQETQGGGEMLRRLKDKHILFGVKFSWSAADFIIGIRCCI